jgi:hypothetical protein
MNKKLRIKVTSNPNAVHALGISEDRYIEITNAINNELNRLRIKGMNLVITSLAQKVVEQLDPNENEFFFIGMQIGDLYCRNVMYYQSLQEMDMLANGGGPTPVKN